ncbi:MAG: carbohydrate ABC transporter permease [Clostridia bacterium]|nr:carbohydrate ABC transporter permease [Clostridia bacterium]
MDTNMQNTPKITKESKNKIRVEFDRTPLKERLKAKFLNLYFFQKVAWMIFRLVLLVGISYVVLFPFISKIAGSFMSPEDFVDVTVRLIPKNFTLDIYKAVLFELDYWEAFRNTFIISLLGALLQTFVCCLIGYGLAKFRFKGNNLVMLLVVLTMIVPHQTLQLSMFMGFRYFDILGILSFLSGGASIGFMPESFNEMLAGIQIINLPDHGLALTNTYAPLLILSATGLAFKNGLYIFMLRQFFTGVPDALEESAYIDGSGVFRTFFTIILPLSIPMMVTVFLFAFCWQWTDDFYTELFFTTSKITLMPDVVDIPTSLKTDYAGQNMYYTAIRNTCGICIIMPLVILYCFGQNFLVQGIERSGLTAE